METKLGTVYLAQHSVTVYFYCLQEDRVTDFYKIQKNTYFLILSNITTKFGSKMYSAVILSGKDTGKIFYDYAWNFGGQNLYYEPCEEFQKQ